MTNMINEDIARLNGLADRIALLASGSLTDAQARALMKGLIGEIKRAYSNLRYYMEQGTYGQGSFVEVASSEGRAPQLAPLLAKRERGDVAAISLLERADVAALVYGLPVSRGRLPVGSGELLTGKRNFGFTDIYR